MNMIMLSQLPNQLMLSFWTSSDTGCRLSFGIMLLTSESQSWITVLCSIDRLLGVIAPNRFSFVKKMKFCQNVEFDKTSEKQAFQQNSKKVI